MIINTQLYTKYRSRVFFSRNAEAFCRNSWNLTAPEKSWSVSIHDLEGFPSRISRFPRQCSDARRSWTLGNWVALNVDQGGPTLWPTEGSGLSIRRTVRPVPAFQRTSYMPGIIPGIPYEYAGTAVYVLCISTHHPFRGYLLVRAAPGLMGRAQGRSSSPQSFSEDCSNVWGEVREVRSPAAPSSPKERALKNTWYMPGTWYTSTM